MIKRLIDTGTVMVGLLLTVALASPALAEGQRHEVPETIASDGSEDVTEALMEFFAGVPDGSTIVFPEGAEYNIEGTLTIADRNNLTFEGNGAVFVSRDKITEGGRRDIRNRAHWQVDGDSSGITFRNLTVLGPNNEEGVWEGRYDDAWDADREAQHAFDLRGGSGILIEGCRMRYVFGDGVYIRTDGVVVRDSEISHAGRQGIAIASGHDILIENNDIRTIRRGMIDVEPFSRDWGIDNVRIIGNTFGNNRLMWMPMGSRGWIGVVFVADNVLEESISGIANQVSSRGIDHHRGPMIVVNNRIRRRGGSDANRFRQVEGIFFAGNHLSLPERREMTAFRFDNSPGALVAGNYLEGAGGVMNLRNMDESGAFEAANDAPARETDWSEFEPGAYAARIVDHEGGEAIAVWRGGWDLTNGSIAQHELSTDGTAAWVYVNADGEVLSHYTTDDTTTATFRGESLLDQ